MSKTKVWITSVLTTILRKSTFFKTLNPSPHFETVSDIEKQLKQTFWNKLSIIVVVTWNEIFLKRFRWNCFRWYVLQCLIQVLRLSKKIFRFQHWFLWTTTINHGHNLNPNPFWKPYIFQIRLHYFSGFMYQDCITDAFPRKFGLYLCRIYRYPLWTVPHRQMFARLKLADSLVY